MQGTLNQPYVMLLCLYLGAAGGIGWDLSCLLTRLGGGRKWVQAISELLFCLGYGLLCLYCWGHLLQLELRAYYALGLFLGWGLYRFGIRSALATLLRKIYEFSHKKGHKK